MIIHDGVEGVRDFMQAEIEKRGCNIKELAEVAGISPTTIRRFISDDVMRRTKSPHFRTMYATVRALGFQLRISNH
jgi:DNA-binding phage protein